MLAVAKLPAGETKTLIHIPRWDLNWQAVFTYATPIDLPAGTTISMRYIYDNSADNLANPNTPPKRVVAAIAPATNGPSLAASLPHSPATGANDPRRVLQEAIARHHVENNPRDFEAHYNLAAMLQTRGELSQSPSITISVRSLSAPAMQRWKTRSALRSSPHKISPKPSRIFPSPRKLVRTISIPNTISASRSPWTISFR